MDIIFKNVYPKNKYYYDGVDRFIVITVATEENENLQNFRESCDYFNIPYIILGMGDEWSSGKAENGVLLEPGGAQKINYLKNEIKDWENLQDHIILFTDSYDVIFTSPPVEIITKFRNFKKQIVFSAEKTCWPDTDVESLYPIVNSEYQFLNSGGFIGYGDRILNLISEDVDNSEDDQRYYTKKFFEDQDNIVLDYQQNIFQTLNLALEDVEVDTKLGRLNNLKTKQTPSVIHANGPQHIKDYLYNISNILFRQKERSINSEQKHYPTESTLSINIMLDIEVNDINQVFDQIRYLTYPKQNITFNIFYNDDTHEYKIDKFVNRFGGEYRNTNTFNLKLNRAELRNQALVESKIQGSDYTLIIDCNYVFRNRKGLEFLISEGKDIITPMVKEENSEWVNFSINTNEYGLAKRTQNETQIYSYELRGCWKVNYSAGMWLINNSIIDEVQNIFTDNTQKFDENDDYDIILSLNLKNMDIPQYLSNNFYYGGIIP